jgi:tetratricopeptide (TPR) repeat protein
MAGSQRFRGQCLTVKGAPRERGDDAAGSPRHGWRGRPRQFLVVACIAALLLVFRPAAPALAGYYYMSRGAQALEAAEHGTPHAQQLEQLTSDLELAARRLPDDALPFRYLARAYALAGRADDAVAALERAYELQPDSMLVRSDLVAAYEAAGRPEQAALFSRDIGLSAEQLVSVADQYMTVRRYAEALSWYSRAVEEQPAFDAPTVLRRAVAAVGAGDPQADRLAAALEQQDPAFAVPRLDGELLFNGGELIWLSAVGSEVGYGTHLNYPYDGSDGNFWWDGRAGAFVRLERGGTFLIEVHVQHHAPPPIAMALGVDGQPRAQLDLARGDDSWETVSLTVDLAAGVHSVDLWFLNNGSVNGVDRNATVAWVRVSEG